MSDPHDNQQTPTSSPGVEQTPTSGTAADQQTPTSAAAAQTPPQGAISPDTGGMGNGLTHFNAAGEAHMVDVGDKAVTHRAAVAGGRISMLPATFEMVCAGTHKKGDVLGIARVAGIMAAKRTSELVPLCHPIGLTRVDVVFRTELADSSVHCEVRAETRSQTGVEMEALIGLQVALATIYDMCKAVDRGMCMTDIRLLEKIGGKSGDYRAE